MKKTNIEYYRIANGKNNEDGSLVILKGLTGYNLEKAINKNGIEEIISVDKFIDALEKSASKPDNMDITKITNKKDKELNQYKISYNNNKKDSDGMIIKIDKDVSKNNPELVTRFDNIKNNNISYENTKHANELAGKAKGFSLKAAKLAGVTFIGTALIWGTVALTKNKFEHLQVEQTKYAEQIKQDEQNLTEEEKAEQERLGNIAGKVAGGIGLSVVGGIVTNEVVSAIKERKEKQEEDEVSKSRSR